MIGLFLWDIQGDFPASLIKGIEAVTSSNGYGLLVSLTLRSSSLASSTAPLGPQNVDGLLIFAHSLEGEPLFNLNQAGFPMVLIHYSSSGEIKIPCVTVENKNVSPEIVNHLIVKHHRERIVFLREPVEHEDSHWRELGYSEALKARGLAFDPRLVAFGGFERQIAARTIRDLVETGVEFDGVFAGDDEAAAGVLAALPELGLNVPEDVSVVGFNVQRLAQYLHPPLTTVRASTGEVGKVAAQQLINIIQYKEVADLTLLPIQLVIRQSCGCQI